MTAYRSPTVAVGTTCQSEIRTCSNGTLSGNYTFNSCSVSTVPSVIPGSAAGATGVRKYQMALWANTAGLDSDYPMFYEGEPQPQGESLMLIWSWYDPNFPKVWSDLVTNFHLDTSRIKAFVVDEPFWSATGGQDWTNPCYNKTSARWGVIQPMDAALKTTAAFLKSVAPKTRFWINFSEPEIKWAQDTACPVQLIGNHIDVISLDVYGQAFEPNIHAYYNWIMANRTRPTQQIGLVPGTFYVTTIASLSDQAAMAGFLSGFFTYADQMNSSCNIPSIFPSDGCPMWMIAGWPAATYGTIGDWRGERDPNSGLIQAAWQTALAKPVLDPMLGAVESVTASGIVGWAIDRKGVSGPVYVDTYIDDQYISTVNPSLPRSDILQTYGITNAGFNISIPASYRNGQTHSLKVYVIAPSDEGWNHILIYSNSFSF